MCDLLIFSIYIKIQTYYIFSMCDLPKDVSACIKCFVSYICGSKIGVIGFNS